MRPFAMALMLVGLTANTSTLAEAHDEAQFQPAGPWAINYADESCRLIRNFSSGSQTITLAFERFIPGPSMRLGIAGDALKIGPNTRNLKYRYGPEGQEKKRQLLVSELADGRKSYLVEGVRLLDTPASSKELGASDKPAFSWSINEELAAARKVNSITLGVTSDHMLTIEIGPMEEPIKALQGCIADLMKDWGVSMDQIAHATRQAEPISNPQTWIRSSDYPAEMLRDGKEGVVGFRLVVDEQGGVKQCFVDIDKSGPFEMATCNAVKAHARFKPALDADGKPMPTIYSCRVNYRLF